MPAITCPYRRAMSRPYESLCRLASWPPRQNRQRLGRAQHRLTLAGRVLPLGATHSTASRPGRTAGRSWIRDGGTGAWGHCSHGLGPRKDPCRPSTDQHGLSEWARGGCPDTGMQRSVRGSLIKGDITSPTTRYRGCGPCQAKRPGRGGQCQNPGFRGRQRIKRAAEGRVSAAPEPSNLHSGIGGR